MSLMERLQKIVTVAQSTQPVASKETLEARLKTIMAPVYRAVLRTKEAGQLKRVAGILGEKSTVDFRPLLKATTTHTERFGPDAAAILAPTQEQADAATASAQKLQDAAQEVLEASKADLRKAIAALRRSTERVAALQKIPEINEAIGDSAKQENFRALYRELRDFLNRLDRALTKNDMEDLQRIAPNELMVWRGKIRAWNSTAEKMSLDQLQARYALSEATVKLLKLLVEGKTAKLADAKERELTEILKLPGLARMLTVRLEG